MPSRARGKQAVYNTPTIRNGGFGFIQVEAIHNRPMSIARRHLAASELRMRSIEPNELSSSEWVRFLVMEPAERERWIAIFEKRRRNSNESTASTDSGTSSTAAAAVAVEAAVDSAAARAKVEEARWEAEEAEREVRRREMAEAESSSVAATIAAAAAVTPSGAGRTPSVSIWARQFDDQTDGGEYSARRPRHARRAVTEGIIDAPPPPTYETAVRARTPPPAYEPRSDDDEPASPRHIRFAV